MLLLSSTDSFSFSFFFKINLFKNFFQEHYQSVKQFGSYTITVCKGYQLTTKVAASKERVNMKSIGCLIIVCLFDLILYVPVNTFS